MQAESEETPYQVSCPNCKVTFALGTKRCLHCGERLGGKRRATRIELPGAEEDIVIEAEEPGRRGLRISPVTLLWIVLLIGAGVQRACESM